MADEPTEASVAFDRPAAVAVLAEAADRGFLGGDVDDHLDHSVRFAAAVRALGLAAGWRIVDLGSGGGIPGLVAALVLPRTGWALVDAASQRVAWLAQAIERLGLTGSAEAVHARAEDLGRDPRWREAADVVVSRAFGRPAVVAECAAPLLRVGGHLVVSEPPAAEDRWPVASLTGLGLGAARRVAWGFVALSKVAPTPQRYPRRAGVPERRPLF